MTSFIAACGSGRSTSVIPAVPAAWSVTTIAFIVIVSSAICFFPVVIAARDYLFQYAASILSITAETLLRRSLLPFAHRGAGRRFPIAGMYSFHSGWKPLRRASGGKRSLDGRGQRVVTGVEDEDCKQLRLLGLARVAADRVCRVRRFGPALAGPIDVRLAVIHPRLDRARKDRKSTRLNSST